MKGWGTTPELAVSVELGVQSLGRQVVVPKPTALALGQEGFGPPAQHAPGLCLQGHVGQRDVQEGPAVPCVGLWDGRSLIPPAPVSGDAQPGAGSALGRGQSRGPAGVVEQDPSLPPRSGRELSAAGGARGSSAAPGQRSRLWLRLQPCPAPGFGCALRGCLLPVPPPESLVPHSYIADPCPALCLAEGGVASSRSLWQLSHPPALVLAGFPCKCSAVNPCVIPSPPAPPGRAGAL